MNKDNIEINNNSCNNSCNNDNEYNIKLYNSAWNNIVIKRIILNHLNIFNILYNNIEFISIEEWDQFKYKDYLNTVTLGFYSNICQCLKQLPQNCKHIIILPIEKSNINETFNSIPNHIESLKFSRISAFHNIGSLVCSSSSNISGTINSTSSSSSSTSSSLSKLKSISLLIDREQQNFKILSSITYLNLYLSSTCNLKLEKSSLPLNLKVLEIDRIGSFEDGCLPESLTRLSFRKIENPILINQLSINGLVRLELNMDGSIKSNIRFPNTLEYLDIFRCYSFNATLPNNIKSFTMYMTKFKYEIQFPSSLEHIHITYSYNILNQEIFQHRDSAPINLKSLNIKCSSIEDENGDSILPDTLETLTLIYYDQELKENQLPSSLTHLKLNLGFNQAIGINVLPSSLKILELLDSSYSHVINPLAIPSQLELLRISNNRYNHPINLKPSTHPNAVIDCSNLNLYYDPSNTDIRALRLPLYFKSQLSTLQLQDKSKLEYLYIDYLFNHPFQISDLPINNQIKTLELTDEYIHTINLEYFQNLESIIIINRSHSLSKTPFTPITTTIDNNGEYNYYKLKEIKISNSNYHFIKHLDINFYKFIVINK